MTGPSAAERLRIDRARAALLSACRDYFTTREYCEVITPVLVTAPATEENIDAMQCTDSFLRTSPELEMKMLLARGHSRIYQIGPCFREGEYGRLHRPEFLMLEWYRTHGDHLDVLLETRGLLLHTLEALVRQGVLANDHLGLRQPWETVTVREAFLQHAGWDPTAHFDPDRFWYDLAECVEPALPRDRPVVLTEYPTAAGTFARVHREIPQVAQRWELYIAGVEVANGCSEIISAPDQLARLQAAAARRRQHGKPVYPMPSAFLQALEDGLPPCAGVALGLDRLLMLLLQADSLDAICPFPPPG